MAYSFKSVTIRTDNSESGMAKINELWADIMTGKIPLDFIANGAPVKGLSANLNVLLLSTMKAPYPPNTLKTVKHIAICT